MNDDDSLIIEGFLLVAILIMLIAMVVIVFR